jgi:hypothetical protein
MLALFMNLEKEAQGLNAKTSMDYPSREAKLMIKRYCETIGVSVANFTMSLYRNAVIAGFDKANLSPEAYKEALEDLEKYMPSKKHLTEHPFLKNVDLAYGRHGKIEFFEEGAYEKIKELGGIIPVGAWREATSADDPPNERVRYVDQLGNFFDKDFYWWDPSFEGWYNKLPLSNASLFFRAICDEKIELSDFNHPIFTAKIKDTRFSWFRDEAFDSNKIYLGVPDTFKDYYKDTKDEEQRKLIAENAEVQTIEEIAEKLAGNHAKIEHEQALQELYAQENTVSGFNKPVISLSQIV